MSRSCIQAWIRAISWPGAGFTFLINKGWFSPVLVWLCHHQLVFACEWKQKFSSPIPGETRYNGRIAPEKVFERWDSWVSFCVLNKNSSIYSFWSPPAVWRASFLITFSDIFRIDLSPSYALEGFFLKTSCKDCKQLSGQKDNNLRWWKLSKNSEVKCLVRHKIIIVIDVHADSID